MSNSLLFRALPVVQFPHHQELQDTDFELVQITNGACPLSETLGWYWQNIGDLTLLNQKEMEAKRSQGDNGEVTSLADISKALARSVGDLWNFQLRNVLSAVTYLQPQHGVVKFKTTTPLLEQPNWTHAQFYDIEVFVKFTCEFYHTSDQKKLPSIDLKDPLLSTKAMIVHLVNAFLFRDMATLNAIKMSPPFLALTEAPYIAWKQVMIPLMCFPVPARPGEDNSGIFLNQRQGISAWRKSPTTPFIVDATGYR